MGQGEKNLQNLHLRIKKHHLESGFDNNGDIKKLMKKALCPLFMDGIQLPQGNRATMREKFTFYH